MNPPRVIRLALLACTLAVCASCAQLEQVRNVKLFGKTFGLGESGTFWNDTGRGPARIVVDLGEQRAYFYRGKRIVGRSTISSGRKGFETPPGKYRVIQKDEDHVSNLYGDFIAEDGTVVQSNVDVRKDARPSGSRFDGAEMPYFLRFRGGYGMHAGYVPRHRASHGCIRMPTRMARRFYEAARIGTPVIVKG